MFGSVVQALGLLCYVLLCSLFGSSLCDGKPGGRGAGEEVRDFLRVTCGAQVLNNYTPSEKKKINKNRKKKKVPTVSIQKTDKNIQFNTATTQDALARRVSGKAVELVVGLCGAC